MNDDIEQPEGQSSREPSLLEVTWRTLKSTRTTLYVFIAIAITTTVGTIIPQGQPAEYYGMKYTEGSSALILRLGLDRLYTSNFFYLLVTILLLNLLACAGRAWRRARAQYRGPGIGAAQRLAMSDDKCVRTDLPVTEAAQEAVVALRRHGYSVTEERGEKGEVWLVGLKHRFAAFGTVLTHYSIFTLAAGAILGSIAATSLDTTFMVNEGETYRDEKGSFDFEVGLRKFDLEYHPDGASVSKYASDVVITRNGQQIQSGTIAVNRPMKVGSVSLFQSSWGISGFTVKITGPDGQARESFVPVEEGTDDMGNRAWDIAQSDRVIWLVERQSALIVSQFAADAAVENGEVIGSMSEYPRNPAVQLVGLSGFKKGAQHDFKDLGWVTGGKSAEYQGYKVELGEVRKWSGLGVRRDLGLPLVWFSFIALMIGLMLQLYTQPRTALVSLHPRGKGAQIAIAVRGGQVNASDEDLRSLTQAVSGSKQSQ